ncbi:MAG TPA: UDP-3-O-acyl-N-acetylglucosamine deacetylase [Chthonomonadales bacterium]|nr:UDP-3-O-acyl-N-acetylglucosamine deacetylase [Chthonomonadales bacterium]
MPEAAPIGLPARRQRTVGGSFELRGVGIHSGATCTARVEPAAECHGIAFVVAGVTIPAVADCVVETTRCTTLGRDGARIGTVEHLLAALAGLCVDNAVVAVDGPELPAIDGSALPWVEAILGAGVIEQSATAAAWSPETPEVLSVGASWYVAIPSSDLVLTCVSSFEHPMLGVCAVAHRESAGAFARDIAPARTFGLAEEVERLLAAGLALGGSLDNSLVVYPDRFSTPLRLPDEWARHKMLDLIGDLSLAGVRVAAAITAICPGHQGNAAFAARLRACSAARGPRSAVRGRHRAGARLRA